MTEKEDLVETCRGCASEFGGLGCLVRLTMARTAPTDDDREYHLSIVTQQLLKCPLKASMFKKVSF